MPTNLRIHVAAGGLLFVLITVIALFWSFPKLLVYVLLAIVAALAYGALYLILAAWMDPKEEERPTTIEAPPRGDDARSDVTEPDLGPAPGKPARRPRKKAKKAAAPRKKKTKKSQ